MSIFQEFLAAWDWSCSQKFLVDFYIVLEARYGSFKDMVIPFSAVSITPPRKLSTSGSGPFSVDHSKVELWQTDANRFIFWWLKSLKSALQKTKSRSLHVLHYLHRRILVLLNSKLAFCEISASSNVCWHFPRWASHVDSVACVSIQMLSSLSLGSTASWKTSLGS